jgi:hypothetical protein
LVASASDRVRRAGRARAARLAAARALLATTVAAGMTGTAAAAAARGTVVVDAAACPSVPEAAIRRIVAIEIGDLLADAGVVPAAGANRLSLACDGAAARLAARRDGGDPPIERVLPLADFPGDAAPRALALAGVEMLAALDPAVRERVQIRQSTPPPAPATPPPRADRSAAPVGIALSAVRRQFVAANGAGGWGARIDLDRGLTDWFALGLDLEIDGARATVPLGEARALILSAGVFAGPRAAGTRVAGTLALGARGGLASLEGTPAGGSGARGGSALRPWWGPAIAARGWIRAGAVDVAGAVEAGVTARGAQGLADGATVIALDGVWVAAALGLRF